MTDERSQTGGIVAVEKQTRLGPAGLAAADASRAAAQSPVDVVLAIHGRHGVVQYSSHETHCPTGNQPAVLTVVSRLEASPAVRFVLWCSLRGMDLCDERCLGAAAPAPRQGEAGRESASEPDHTAIASQQFD